MKSTFQLTTVFNKAEVKFILLESISLLTKFQINLLKQWAKIREEKVKLFSTVFNEEE